MIKIRRHGRRPCALSCFLGRMKFERCTRGVPEMRQGLSRPVGEGDDGAEPRPDASARAFRFRLVARGPLGAKPGSPRRSFVCARPRPRPGARIPAPGGPATLRTRLIAWVCGTGRRLGSGCIQISMPPDPQPGAAFAADVRPAVSPAVGPRGAPRAMPASRRRCRIIRHAARSA